MKICFINGSPGGEKSCSLFFLCTLQGLLERNGSDAEIASVRCRIRGALDAEDISGIRNADVVVIAFPLFVYSLPGALTRLLEDWHASLAVPNAASGAAARVYAIVNCGFARPETNEEAVRVLRNFCRRAGLQWRFALSIGGGRIVKMTARAPLVRRTLMTAVARMAEDIRASSPRERETISVKPIIPSFIGIRIRRTMEWRAERRRKKAVAAAGFPV